MGDRTNSAGSDRTAQERGTFSGLGPSQRIARLDPAQCMRLITPGGVGRVGYTGAQGPEIVPVNFAVINEAVVFRTLSGGVVERLAGDRVAFEVDRIDEATRSGWNVLVQGVLSRITDRTLVSRTRNATRAWAGGDRDACMRIVPDRLSGRRMGPGEELRR